MFTDEDELIRRFVSRKFHKNWRETLLVVPLNVCTMHLKVLNDLISSRLNEKKDRFRKNLDFEIEAQ